MSTMQELEPLIAALSPGEKAQVLGWIARDLNGAFVGIEKTSHVNGGEACIVRTRIPVWLLVTMRRHGLSEADILQNYPTLRAEDLANAWAYAQLHNDEIEQAILENESA